MRFTGPLLLIVLVFWPGVATGSDDAGWAASAQAGMAWPVPSSPVPAAPVFGLGITRSNTTSTRTQTTRAGVLVDTGGIGATPVHVDITGGVEMLFPLWRSPIRVGLGLEFGFIFPALILGHPWADCPGRDRFPPCALSVQGRDSIIVSVSPRGRAAVELRGFSAISGRLGMTIGVSTPITRRGGPE